MNTTTKTIGFELSRPVTCAALAMLTTLGMFSLIANVMPPLVTDTLVLATSHQTVCVPVTHVLESAGHVRHSAI
jgi:hypothetical protein